MKFLKWILTLLAKSLGYKLIRRRKVGPKFDLRIRNRPEAKIQLDLIEFLEKRGWYCKVIHGNAFQNGLPDLFTCHPKWKQRWIEVKNPKQYSFTQAQKENFPKMDRFGVGIWILVAATEDEYNKLWKPPNWHEYLSVNKVRTRIMKPKPHAYVPRFPFKVPNGKNNK